MALIAAAYAQRRFASALESPVFGTVLLIPNGITLTLLFGNTKLGYQFTFHSFRCERKCDRSNYTELSVKAIQPRIVRIPFARVHVVGGEDDPFTQQLVIEHQQRAVEELELIVPENVKNLGFAVAA